MPYLILRTPAGEQRHIELDTSPKRFGRADHCDVILRDDAEVSREHATIQLDDEGNILVADVGSKNGTRVDEGEVFRNAERTALYSVRIGEHELEVHDAVRPDGATPPVRFAPDRGSDYGDTQFFPSSRGLADFSQQRLALLMQLTERIGGVFERKQLLEQALDAVCESLGFERGLIALKTQRGDPELPVTRNVERDETGAFKISRSLINRALVDGERAIVNNPATDLVGNMSESLVRFPIQSALCVPILYREEILGVMYGDRITKASTYQPADVDFLAAIAQQVGVGLANLRMMQEHVRSQRMYAELEQARVIQRRLLPAERLTVGPLSIAGYNEASSAVSGDYFDYFLLDDGRLGLIIADVTGHGLPAALLMANLQSAVRVALLANVSLPQLAGRLNRLIFGNTSSSVFITAIFGTVDIETGDFEYIGAGHPPPLLLKRGEIVSPEIANALPLGIDPNEAYEVIEIAGARWESMLLFTDGVIEAADREGAVLGHAPVREALARQQKRDPESLIDTTRQVVRRQLAGADNDDDMTLLALHFDRGV